MGLDEVRRFNVLSGAPMPVYGDARDARASCARTFAYVFDRRRAEGRRRAAICGSGRIGGPFCLGRQEIVPVPLLHGPWPILGFRFGRFAYLTDCSAIPDASLALLDGLDVLVLDALRHRPHPTHFTRRAGRGDGAAHRRAADVLHAHRARPRPRRRRARRCPPGMALAYDGLDARSVERRAVRCRSSTFPTIAAARRGRSPVAALGNFDGLHRGHMKLIERVRRAGRRARRHAGRDDLRSASAARAAARQGAAAAHDARPEARGVRARRHAGRRDRAVHARAVALGAGAVRRDGAHRLAARRGGVGRRELSVRPRSLRHVHAAARARRGPRLPRREDRSGALQGLRRLEHAHPAAGRRRAASTRPARCSAITTSSTAWSCTATAAAATLGFPTANLETAQRAAAGATASTRPSRSSTGSSIRR